jgi:hypothetical protein
MYSDESLRVWWTRCSKHVDAKQPHRTRLNLIVKPAGYRCCNLPRHLLNVSWGFHSCDVVVELVQQTYLSEYKIGGVGGFRSCLSTIKSWSPRCRSHRPSFQWLESRNPESQFQATFQELKQSSGVVTENKRLSVPLQEFYVNFPDFEPQRQEFDSASSKVSGVVAQGPQGSTLTIAHGACLCRRVRRKS